LPSWYLQFERYLNEMQNICHELMGQDTSCRAADGADAMDAHNPYYSFMFSGPM
jgi:hypothetical protein